jgi:hypothetical protein
MTGRSTPTAKDRAPQPAFGGRCDHATRRFPASCPLAAEDRGYGGVEDPLMLLYAALVCAALTVVTFLAFPHPKDRRLVRLHLAQEKWADLMDRRW